jgi:KDO2-lipid IV(A) lauroyltransferase
MSAAATMTRAAAALLPRLTFPLAAGLGRALGSLAWAVDSRHRVVALQNLAQAFPHLSQSQRARIALQAFQQAGRTATEMLWSAALDDTSLPRVARFVGMEHLDAALAAGRGAIITTAHFGNWELMGVALAHVGVPMNVIARRLDDAGVEAVLHHLRTRTGAQVIHKEEAVRAALRALRDGQVVGVLIDQNTVAEQASFVPFFGRLAATTRISAQLHVRTGAPIIMLFCVPEADRYRFVIEPLQDVVPVDEADDGGGGERAVERLTAAATRQIEQHIRRCPEAWLWIHDRWRTRPPRAPSA